MSASKDLDLKRKSCSERKTIYSNWEITLTEIYGIWKFHPFYSNLVRSAGTVLSVNS
jgi:hypothetical protein